LKRYIVAKGLLLQHTVAYLLLGELGDARPFGFFEQFGQCPPFPLGGNLLGEDYG